MARIWFLMIRIICLRFHTYHFVFFLVIFPFIFQFLLLFLIVGVKKTVNNFLPEERESVDYRTFIDHGEGKILKLFDNCENVL